MDIFMFLLIKKKKKKNNGNIFQIVTKAVVLLHKHVQINVDVYNNWITTAGWRQLR